MREGLVRLLCCPFCLGEFSLGIFRLDPQRDDDVEEGSLLCTLCMRRYPILKGIPRILPMDLFHLFDFTLFRERYPSEFRRISDSHKFQGPENSPLENLNWNTEEMRFWETKYNRDLEDSRTRYEFAIKNAPFARRSWQNRLVPRERIIFRHLRDEIVLESHVLEIGCGKAITISNLLNPRDRNYHYIGTDLSGYALELSKRFVEGDFVQCLAEALPFKNQTMDALLSFGCLEHIPGHENNIVRLLNRIRSGGYFGMQEAIGRPSGLSRPFKILKKLLPEESPHEESINLRRAMRFLERFCEIIEIDFEGSVVQTWMNYLFGPAVSRSARAFRIVEVLDKTTIQTAGRINPVFNRGLVTLLAKKFI